MGFERPKIALTPAQLEEADQRADYLAKAREQRSVTYRARETQPQRTESPEPEQIEALRQAIIAARIVANSAPERANSQASDQSPTGRVDTATSQPEQNYDGRLEAPSPRPSSGEASQAQSPTTQNRNNQA